MKEILLITAGSRPASVFFRGGFVRIDVHDAWYKRTLRRLKADIVALHPDKVISGFRRRRPFPHRRINLATAYNQALRSLQIWKREQEEWYAEFGLESPKVLGMAKVT